MASRAMMNRLQILARHPQEHDRMRPDALAVRIERMRESA